MTKNYFKRVEFFKKVNLFYVTGEVVNKIDYHIELLNPIREVLGIPIHISKNSGFRPRAYELARGRSGNSQHTFAGRGAVDVTCDPKRLEDLVTLLKTSGYTRICYYPKQKFIHCDLKYSNLVTFLANSGRWIRDPLNFSKPISIPNEDD